MQIYNTTCLVYTSLRFYGSMLNEKIIRLQVHFFIQSCKYQPQYCPIKMKLANYLLNLNHNLMSK
jgi:hypothetical protein